MAPGPRTLWPARRAAWPARPAGEAWLLSGGCGQSAEREVSDGTCSPACLRARVPPGALSGPLLGPGQGNGPPPPEFRRPGPADRRWCRAPVRQEFQPARASGAEVLLRPAIGPGVRPVQWVGPEFAPARGRGGVPASLAIEAGVGTGPGGQARARRGLLGSRGGRPGRAGGRGLTGRHRAGPGAQRRPGLASRPCP